MEKKIEMKRKQCSTESDVNKSHTITEPAVLGVTRYISNELRNIITFVVTK